MNTPPPKDQRRSLYLIGINVTHSIALPMHNAIAHQLSLSWTFTNRETPTLASIATILRSPTFAGAVITMPYKAAITAHVDILDDLAVTLGACNNVYRDAQGRLHGTNTDWRGVVGALQGASAAGTGRVAMIVGAGGAARAAAYALCVQLECKTLYVVNRDAGEVAALVRDVGGAYGRGVEVVHVETVEQARNLTTPFYVVGTVPDCEPSTEAEGRVRDVQREFLGRGGESGVVLDMCYKPRVTRMVRLAKKNGWRTVEGVDVIGHQAREQWRLWTLNDDGVGKVDEEAAWAVLRETAETSPAINF